MVLSAQKKLLAYVDEHPTSYKEVWNLLSTQCNSSTTYTYTIEENHQFHTLLASQLQQRGLQSRQISPHLLYAEHISMGTPHPHTLLLCHSYTPHTSNTQVLAACAAFLCALDVYKNSMGSLPIGIQWLLVSNATQQHIFLEVEELQRTPDGCIWYYDVETGLNIDTPPVLALGTKGLLHVELEIQTANSLIDAMHGGIAPDPLWRLLWALNSLKDAREDILIEGFYDTLTPAADDTVTQLHLLPDITSELVQRWGIQQPLMGLHDFQLHYAHLLLPTCTVHNVVSTPQSAHTEAGIPTIPMQAKAQVIFYLVPDQDPQDIFTKLQQHLQSGGFSDVQARVLSSSHPLSTSITSSFVQHIIQATEAAYAQKPSLLPSTIGSYTAYQPWMKASVPIVFIPRNVHNEESDLTGMVKQIILLIERIAHANDTTE